MITYIGGFFGKKWFCLVAASIHLIITFNQSFSFKSLFDYSLLEACFLLLIIFMETWSVYNNVYSVYLD